MKHVKRLLVAILVMVLAIGISIQPPQASAAASDYVTVSKSVNPTTITTEQEAEVSLTVKGTPPVDVVVPNDVILIVDKSGSMLPSNNNGEDKMTNAKEAAKGFIDLMDMTKHRVGIVDFSSVNMIGSFDLTTDKTAAKNYIDSINANGSTSTGDAIQKAMDMLANHRPEAQPVIVLLTDGDATYPTNDPYGYAKQKAQLAKEAGIIFYTIALLKQTDNPDTSGPNILLKEMATTAGHHHFVLGSTGLSDIYAAIVKEIGLASAYDVTVTDVVSSGFEIVPGSYDNNIPKPEVTGNKLVWTFNELKSSALTFTYKIRPVDKTKAGSFVIGTSESSLTYKDYAGASRTKLIPNPTLNVVLPPPTITSIVEPQGHPIGGNTITINGTGFQQGASVLIGANYATNVQVVDAKQITATVPPGAQGVVKVTVTNPDKQAASSEYRYMADPIIDSIVPNNGPMAGGNIVAVNGNYLMQGVEVLFGTNKAVTYSHAGATYMKVTVPASDIPGAVDVTFTNPDGTKVVVPNGYTYNEPPVEKLEITTISPNKGLLAGGEAIYIDGKKIDTNAKVYFGSTEVGIATYYSDTRIRVVAPSAAQVGSVDVSIVNPDGTTATLTAGYTYEAPPELPAPTVSALTPANGPLAGGNTVYIDGANFVNGVKVYVNNVEAVVNNYYSATRLKATIPAGTAPGLVDVKVVNPDGKEGVKVGGYTYDAPPTPPAPTISLVTPANGLLAGGEIVYIDGTGFQSGLKVYIGSNEAPVLTYYSDLRIKVSAPAANAAGKVDVRIVNPDNQEVTLSGGYEYIVPAPLPVTVTGITPNTGLTKGGEVVVITGTNFKNDTQVTFGSNVATMYAYDSATRIRVIAPAVAAPGVVDITVANTDGMSTTVATAYTYEIVKPTITLLSPNHGPMAGGTVVYVDGTNFEANMTVRINGVVVPISTFYGATRFKITVPASSVSGSVPLSVTLANGETVAATYTYDAPPAVPAPTITAISITSGSTAGGYYMYIDGANLTSGLKIYFGSVQATLSSYYGATRIRIIVPAGVAGPVNVQIVNPDGQSSNVKTFTYV